MQRKQNLLLTGAIYVIILTGVIIMVFPFLHMVSTAFKPQTYILEIPPQLIPKEPTLQNFIDVWELQNFSAYFLNSSFVATTATILSIIISSMMAFAFARFDFPGKNLLFWTLVSALMLPWMLLIIPQFLLAKHLHLLNSLWGLILFYTALTLVFNTFLLRSFFEGLPKELEDSARIDGASLFTIYARIVMPLSKPALATIIIFTFLMTWDEFVMALTFLGDSIKFTLPIAIALFQGQFLTQWGLVFAATTIAVIPVIAIFIAFQRYFIKGIATTGLK